MIRNVRDVTNLFDRRFGAAMARPLSLVRTLVWAVLGIYLLGLVVPAPAVRFERTHNNRALQTVPVRDLILNKNDPRGWQHVTKDPHAFTIAWIGGSTIQTVKAGSPGYLPVDVLHRLPDIDGKPVRVNMYLMEASRIFDLYAALADALSTKPDLVVLDLNPLWVFNPNAVQEWPNLNTAAFPDLAPRTGTWPLMGALYSPHDVALSLASGHLSAIRDRWSYSQKLLAGVNDLSPLNEAPAAPARGQPLTGVRLIATMQEPYTFWNRYRLRLQDTNGLPGYPQILRQSRTDGSTMNDAVVAQLLSTLGDSKIPALVYVSAVEPSTLTDPATEAALGRVESHLRQIAAAHLARGLMVQWQSGTRLVQGLRFRDMVHMTFDPPMANLMAAAICAHLKATDPETDCTPTPRRDP